MATRPSRISRGSDRRLPAYLGPPKLRAKAEPAATTVPARARGVQARVLACAFMPRRLLLAFIFIATQPLAFHAVAPVRYTLTFPEPEHRWMQVEAAFSELAQSPLELRMSRSSPGRYSLHDFAKNVYDVHAFARDGRELETTRPDPYGWNVTGHGGSVRVEYKGFGDRVDGTYLAIDETHAHVNMPAANMGARQLE